QACYRLLQPGGRVIITVPAPLVDAVIAGLRRLRLADGMSLDEHHGFDPRTTPDIFTRHGFFLEYRRRFQLGLNNLYVFRKPLSPTTTAGEGTERQGTAQPAAQEDLAHA